MIIMNSIFNMIQFVVVGLVLDESATTLVSNIIHHVLMKFGNCRFVALYDSSHFKSTIITMCQALNLSYEVLTKRNHNEFTVEHFRKFLNKSATIAAADRDTYDICFPTSIVTCYVWNSTLIDGTDILCSISAIGRDQSE